MNRKWYSWTWDANAGDYQYKEVIGYRTKKINMPGEFFYYCTGNGEFYIIEATTGMSLARSYATLKQAIVNTNASIERVGLDKIVNTIQEVIADPNHGKSPRYKEAK